MSIYIGNDLQDRLEALEVENELAKQCDLEDRLKALLTENALLTLSGPAFSVVRQARGGSEAQMPKIKVNINQLK